MDVLRDLRRCPAAPRRSSAVSSSALHRTPLASRYGRADIRGIPEPPRASTAATCGPAGIFLLRESRLLSPLLCVPGWVTRSTNQRIGEHSLRTQRTLAAHAVAVT